MLEFDPVSGSLALPVWLAATLATMIVVLAAFAIARAGALRPVIAFVVLVVLGYAGWLVAERGSGTSETASINRTDERRQFEARASELVNRAMLPGSPLACLDGNAGDQVAVGCEKLVFGGPDTISAAVTYVTARLNMIGEGMELASASGLNYDRALNALRGGLDSDRFGIVAYVLLQNPDCKAERCDGLAMLRDPDKIRVNLLEKPFDVLVMRYADLWQAGRSGVAVVSAPPLPPVPGASAPATAGSGVPISSKYDFPSSSSIPPVSIMNSEPAPSAGKTDVKAAPEAKPAAAAPPKPAPKRAAAPKPPARQAAGPTQLAPAPGAPPAETAQERPAAQQ